MERRIDYKKKDGKLYTTHLCGYSKKEIKKILKDKDIMILSIYKPKPCKHCDGDGTVWVNIGLTI